MHKATFPGRFESLGKISKFVIQAAQEAVLDSDATYQVNLAVDEACSNIIEHSYHGENAGEIHCAYQVNGDRLIITLRDKGTPFNPDLVPEPEIDTPPMERKTGGLGLFFMRKMMDEVRFEFTPDGNKLTMVKYK